MGLFQSSVLKRYTKLQNEKAVEKAYKKYAAYFHNNERQDNIRSIKEEGFQQKFIMELFVNVLNYTINPDPNYNLTTEFKNEKGAKKADGAILIKEKAIAVIELKSTKVTDLERIRQQAFDYKSNHSECVYVITSNFEKLRFYINNAVDFEEFNLFTLNREQFELLYLCLSKENILNNIPLKIKTDSVVEEENITETFYSDYSLFKRELFRDLVKKNLKNEIFRAELQKDDNERATKNIKLNLFKKSQKLIDRFLFIFFAEDKGLLPPNSILQILNKWKDDWDFGDERPLYDIFKLYFKFLDTGRKGTQSRAEIFAYNGGLFKPDSILDSLFIEDNLLLKHTKKLSDYDFESQVGVNILGHIFENSLNEIESVNAEIEGTDFDKQKTKRKKDGVFYTPKYITKYIVDNTVGKLCEEKKQELEINEEEYKKSRKGRKTEVLKKLKSKLTDYRNWLLSITILDPACGSGAFLNQALDFLINEHTYIDELETSLVGGAILMPNIENVILENNIFGVDINEESVDIAKLSLWLRTAQPRRKLNTLNNNIKCGNSLIDSKKVAGNKAFKWEEEFSEIMNKGGFDVVIGNPPYVFARNNISKELKDYYTGNYVSAEYQVNTYLLFIEQTIKLIKNSANYGLIVPNAWLMVSSAKGLRNFVLQNCSINKIINLAGYSFEGVNVETIIIISTKTKNKLENNVIEVLLSSGKEFKHSHNRKQIDFENNDNFEFKVFSDETSVELINKIKNNSENLGDLVNIKAGLQAYEKNKGEPKQTVDDVKNRPFDYTFKYDENTHKYLEGKDVGRYFVNWSGLYLQYGKQLASPRAFNLFNDEKIIIREITGKYPNSIISTYSNELYLYNRSNIAIINREKSEISLKYIVSILNSQLMAYYFVKNTAKSVRKMFPKIILNDLRKFPFKKISKEAQQPFIEKADLMLSLNKELQTEKNNFLNTLKEEKSIEKITKKLDAFYNFEYDTFKKELAKQKIEFKLGDENNEWRKYFNTSKLKINDLQNKINKTDEEIDQMVYKLYELTEEEIKIIEESTKVSV